MLETKNRPKPAGVRVRARVSCVFSRNSFIDLYEVPVSSSQTVTKKNKRQNDL